MSLRPPPPDGRTARWHPAPALGVLVLLAALALQALPFVNTAPNRLLSGEPMYFGAMLQGSLHAAWPAWWMAGALALLMLLAMAGTARATLVATVAVAASLLPAGLLLAAGQARAAAETLSPIARTSLGSGFWLSMLLAGLMTADALQRLAADRRWRSAVVLAVVLALAWLLASGQGDALSLMKEYANRADVVGQALQRHLQIVGVALASTLAVGLPLGWAAHRHARLGRGVLAVLGIVQTIPSIALFGLLMAPLAWLAASWPALGRAGIGGVGMAPAVIALVGYSLLPVVRGMLAGLRQVPAAALQAGIGMGMSAGEVLRQVQLPLALPVVLAGVRTAAVQCVGLAAVTALIGAGGLGTLMFEGLFSNAQDLVLLAVLPIVLLGVLVDAAFRALDALVAVPGHGRADGIVPATAGTAIATATATSGNRFA